MRINGFDWIVIVLTIVGAINWGLIGLLRFDLVAAIFGGPTTLMSRTVYTIVGLAGLYLIYTVSKFSNREVTRD